MISQRLMKNNKLKDCIKNERQINNNKILTVQSALYLSRLF